jgi:hypothetical protein
MLMLTYKFRANASVNIKYIILPIQLFPTEKHFLRITKSGADNCDVSWNFSAT